MRFLLTLLLSLLFQTSAFGQGDWAPLRADTKSYFTYNDHDTIYSLWVDSIKTINGDSVYFLNRILNPCYSCAYLDTCSDEHSDCKIHPESCYFWYNRPQFLMREMHVPSAGVYVLNDTSKFTLLPNNGIGASWLFDTAKAVTAKVVSRQLAVLFPGGPVDSVTTILRSDGETIVLSKNFGVVQWGAYKLVGIDGPDGKKGKWVPEFKDIFDFEIGDMYQYSTSFWHFSYIEHRVVKYKIVEKYAASDTFRYKVSGLNYTYYSDGRPTSWSPYEDTLVYYLQSWNPFLNAHSAQPYFVGNINGFPAFNRTYVIYSENYKRVAKVDDIFQEDFLKNMPDSIPMYRNKYEKYCGMGDLFAAPGLYGECVGTLIKAGGPPTYLIAYSTAKCGSWGTITPDSVITSSAKKIERRRVKIYPNPVTDRLRVETGALGLGTATIFDVSGVATIKRAFVGEETEIDVSDLPSGVYSLKIDANENVIYTRFIKR